MPLPLIALALIAAGAASGGGGVALGGKGAYDIKKARDRLNEAQGTYEARRSATEARLNETNRCLEELGGLQKDAIQDVVVRMGEFLRRNEKKVRESERLLVEGIDATATRVPGLAGLDVDAVAWIGGVIGSTATGVGVGAGVTTAVSTFGIASTGAAISGLSGAAAESATLAALGGGSLASGGGGMALGATALNFVTIGPALLVGGLVIKGQGAKAVTQAREFEATVAVAMAELNETDARLEAVDARAEELAGLLRRLRSRATEALDVLESESFDPQRHVSRFQRAMMLVMAVRNVAATPVVDSEGQMNERAANLTIRYRVLAEEGVK